ncbi:MAG: hypothetical protein ACK5A3_19515, partial [Planctomyces sp.]
RPGRTEPVADDHTDDVREPRRRRQRGPEDREQSREPREDRRGSGPPPVAPEYQDIPTWEDAIGCLSLRTPTEDHARRTENRYRNRDGGGRGPRR